MTRKFAAGCILFSTNYPSKIGDNSSNTDSDPFINYTAAISIREAQRIAEIGKGSNPNWHTSTDLFTTYSDKDFLLGFNCLQMTVGTLCRLAGVYDSAATNIATPEHAGLAMRSPAGGGTAFYDIRGRKIGGTGNKMLLSGKKRFPAGIYLFQNESCPLRAGWHAE